MNDSRANHGSAVGAPSRSGWPQTEPVADRRADAQRARVAASLAPTAAASGNLELPCLIDRLHRRFLDVLRSELTRRHVSDISASQVMMLVTIGDDEISVRHLIERGYYLGSNSSYNLKHLIAAGYVSRTPLPRDRRSAVLKLTAKGRALCSTIMRDITCTASLGRLLGGGDEMSRMIRSLKLLERAWSDLLKYQPEPDWAAGEPDTQGDRAPA